MDKKLKAFVRSVKYGHYDLADDIYLSILRDVNLELRKQESDQFMRKIEEQFNDRN